MMNKMNINPDEDIDGALKNQFKDFHLKLERMKKIVDKDSSKLIKPNLLGRIEM